MVMTFSYSTNGMIHERNDKLDLIKIKNFFVKDRIMRIRRQRTDRMEIFANDTYNKRLLKFNLILKWAKCVNSY